MPIDANGVKIGIMPVIIGTIKPIAPKILAKQITKTTVGEYSVSQVSFDFNFQRKIKIIVPDANCIKFIIGKF